MSEEATANAPAPTTMFQGGESPSQEGMEPQVTTERPDWLLEKFNSADDQAKAYNELYGAYSKKTEDLREEIKAESLASYGESVGVPESAGDYAYPEGFEAPDEVTDTAFRDWAKQNNVGTSAFESLVKDVYGKTQANFEVEYGKLGESADVRINSVNNWVNKNVDEKHYGEVSKLMQTAQGVEFFETIMNKTRSAGFAPETNGITTSNSPLSREAIRELQSDPRFGENSEYTAMVRKQWQQFVEQG